MNTLKVIQDLGYTVKEAQVYLATLGLGEAHVTDIAERAGLPRTTVQATLEKLSGEGLVSSYVQRRYTYWVAEHPERLFARVEQRAEMMRTALPALVALKKAGRQRRPAKGEQEKNLGLLRVMADAVHQPVLVTNEQVEIQYVNSSWEAEMGYSLAEVRGENPRIFQSGKTPRETYERMWKALSAGRLFQTKEIVDRRKHRSSVTLTSTIFPVERSGSTYYIQIFDV